MPQKRATDDLSEAGRAAMSRGFAAGWTAERVAQAIADETGEKVTPRTVARRAREWRQKRDRFEAAKEQYAAMKAAGLDGSQMIEALAFERLVADPEALTGSDPIKFHTIGLEAKRVTLKEREVALREREVAIDERKMKLSEDREKRAMAAMDPKTEMTAEERVAEIREIYGLTA